MRDAAPLARTIRPPRRAARISEYFSIVARRPLLAGIAVIALSLALAVASRVAHGFPEPRIEDEFAYLLGADTFRSGHLTNPTHPMFRYFETYHVLQRPTYTSKYPPANSLFIAVGWALTGHPIVGVWLSFVFMCVAVYWMLLAWVGTGWALGVALVFPAWAATSYWAYSYWGGAVAAGAGALVFGALHRIVDNKGGIGSAVLLGAGMLLLANSRPYEGAVAVIPAAALFFYWLARDHHWSGRRKLSMVVVPLLLVGAAGASWMGVYNRAVTGHWLRMPYMEYQSRYNTTPVFLWQQPRSAIPQDDEAHHGLNLWERGIYDKDRSPMGRVDYVRVLGTEFFGLVIPGMLAGLALLLLPFVWRERWGRFAIATVVWTSLVLAASTFFAAHYVAPLVGVVLALYGLCLRRLDRLSVGGRRLGRTLGVSALVLWFAFGVIALAYESAGGGTRLNPWNQMRGLIGDTLSRGGRRALVVVRYGPEHEAIWEWVYNRANIDASPVVWAHDLGDTDNRPLLEYFHDRPAWLLTVVTDSGPFVVTPYTPRAP